ncbi:SNF2 family N-terminal domain-containing protein [Gaertneriomyces semiglobifer]|nr:SNF2 family N-terminal domain-containing protein [Gaertneriomyces semiglobifer]
MGRIASRTIASSAETQKNMVDEIYKGLSPVELQEQEPNEDVMTRMYGHQKQALWFMCQRERVVDFKRNENKGSGCVWKWDESRRGWVNRLSGEFTMEEPKQWLGGILADEMGLGKTLSVLSLVVARRKGCEIEDQLNSNAGSSTIPATAGSSTTIMIQGSRLVDAKTTLIVTPLSTIPQWIHQIQTHLRPNCVSVHVYHGTGKSTTPETLSNYDIVLTTYGTVGAEYGRVCKITKRNGDASYMDIDGSFLNLEQSQSTPDLGNSSVLGSIHFHRIILDEAHNIKERTTLSSRACHALSARYRWCLTGTPIHNRITDLYGLFRFLRVAPYDAWPVFNALTKRLVKGVVKGSEKQLEHVRGLLRCVTLRRTKGLEVGGKRVLTLPERSVEEVWLTLGEGERRVYDGMWEDARRVFREYEMEVKDEERLAMSGGGDGFGSGGKARKGEGSYANVLEMLLRLRQCVTHLGLLKGTYAQNGDAQTTTCTNDGSVVGKTEATGGDGKTEEEGDGTSEWTATRHAQHVLDLLRENGEDVCVRCHRSVSGVEDADEVEASMCEMDETNSNDDIAPTTTTPTPTTTTTSIDDDDDGVGYAIREDEEVICLDEDRKERRVGVARCGHVFCDRCLSLSNDSSSHRSTAIECGGGGLECGVCQVKLEKGDVVVVGVGPGEVDVASASGGAGGATCGNGGATGVQTDEGVGGTSVESGTSVDLSMIPSTKTRALLRDLLATHRQNLELLNKPTTSTTNTTNTTAPNTNSTTANTTTTTDTTHATNTNTTNTDDQQEKPIKSVVFSQWTTYLSLLASTLDTLHLPYTLLIGSLPLPLRSRNLHRFRTDATCNILLISLKAGGVGLNLTEASNVYLMEPYWNPAVEDQAMDRVWRMGQERRVVVKRFLVERSVEEGMEAVKRSKREVVGRALGENKDVPEKKGGVGGKRERVKELKEVFGFGRVGGGAGRGGEGGE